MVWKKEKGGKNIYLGLSVIFPMIKKIEIPFQFTISRSQITYG